MSHQLFTNCPYEEVEIKSVGNFNPAKNIDANTGKVDTSTGNTAATWIQAQLHNQDIFKAYIPWYLYKPPYGYPRNVNPLELRQFAKNPYIFSVEKNVRDEVTNSAWDIKVKEEFKDNFSEDDRKQILHFFDNPNGNMRETWRTILTCWVVDLIEIGNFIGVKIFNKGGNFSQLVARDASTFLINQDIYGMTSMRADFVRKPSSEVLTDNLPTDFASEYAKVSTAQGLENLNKKYNTDLTREGTYDAMYSENAAYFQYGWTAGARPVPFGNREVIWGEMNSRPDGIYPMSPIQVLWNTILTLQYGLEYNLDFYLNNNLPNGILFFEGATQEQAEAQRNQMSRIFMEKDEYGNKKKQHFRVPITSNKPEFVAMQMTSKEMEVIEQQKWFTKLVWMCFGLNDNEMGFIEDVNKSNGESQERAAVRKVTKPFLLVIEDAINKQLMPEFGHPEFEFKFDDYSIDDDIKKNQLFEAQIRMGIKTPEMVAKELGIDTTELVKQKDENAQKEADLNNQGQLKKNFFGSEKKSSDELSPEQIRELADKNDISYSQLKMGISEEYSEHKEVIGNDYEKAAEIAITHLKKDSEYYSHIKKMEEQYDGK